MNIFLNYFRIALLILALASCEGKRQITAKVVTYTNSYFQYKANLTDNPTLFTQKIEADEFESLTVIIDKEWTEIKHGKGSVFLPSKDIISISYY